MKSARAGIIIGAISALVVLGIIFGKMRYDRMILDSVIADMKLLQGVERDFIESLPIYSDFISPEKERRLRTYLLNAHLKAAERDGVPPVKNEEDIRKLLKEGRLIGVGAGPDSLFYFWGVKKNLRYLTPNTVRGLETIVKRFQENMSRRRKAPPVNIAVSSAVRPSSYQSDLMGKNANATVLSSHSYGVSFDIFYDEYYVRLPFSAESSGLASKIREETRSRYGYLLGASLRRQFRAVLAETLLQLQDEGAIYVILERHQRCYHVTVLNPSERSALRSKR